MYGAEFLDDDGGCCCCCCWAGDCRRPSGTHGHHPETITPIGPAGPIRHTRVEPPFASSRRRSLPRAGEKSPHGACLSPASCHRQRPPSRATHERFLPREIVSSTHIRDEADDPAAVRIWQGILVLSDGIFGTPDYPPGDLKEETFRSFQLHFPPFSLPPSETRIAKSVIRGCDIFFLYSHTLPSRSFSDMANEMRIANEIWRELIPKRVNSRASKLSGVRQGKSVSPARSSARRPPHRMLFARFQTFRRGCLIKSVRAVAPNTVPLPLTKRERAPRKSTAALEICRSISTEINDRRKKRRD